MFERKTAGNGAATLAMTRGLRHGCRASRSVGAICLVVLATASIGACGDDAGQRWYRARPVPGGFRGDHDRDLWPGRGLGGRTRLPEPDASARADAGLLDAGTDAGASLADAGVSAPTDAGASDAGSSPDASASPAQALSDAQILRVADALDAIEIERAQALSPLLEGAELQAFAQAMLDQHQLARDSWSLLSGVLDLLPADSELVGELQADGAAALQQLLGAEPEALSALYLSTEIADHDRALELSSQLIDAADAEALRAQLVVWRAIASDQRAAAEQLSNDLTTASDAGG
jgi:predicted outer membrane protein